MLQVPARLPDKLWMRQPGGPSTPSISTALMREARMLRILTVKSGRIPLVSSSSTSRLSPLWRMLRISMSAMYGSAVQMSIATWRSGQCPEFSSFRSEDIPKQILEEVVGKWKRR